MKNPPATEREEGASMSNASPKNPADRVTREWERLERAEHALWRNSLLLLLALAIGLALATWSTPLAAPARPAVLPAGLVILVTLFGAYVWNKKRELEDLQALLRDLHEAASAPPTEAQFEKLLHIVSRSQHGYRELIDNLDHAVFTLSPEGNLQVANRYMAQVLDVPFQELIGHSFEEFIAEPTRAEAERALGWLLELGNWSGRISLRLKKSGELRFFDCRFQAVRANGEIVSVSGWARDVTPQHESEIRFTELFDSLREGIFFTTLEGVVLDANPALVRLLGYATKAELQALNFRDIYADPSQRDALVHELELKGSVQDREITLRRKDGKTIDCLNSGFVIRDTFGRIVRLQGTLVDITERREIENRLHKEQEFVRRLIAGFPDMIGVFDREGKFTYISQRVQDVLGSPPEEFIEQEFGARAHPDDRPRLAAMFHQLMSGEAPQAQVEYRAQHLDGSWRTLRASAGPLFDAEGIVTGVVASVRDVTETKQFEQQLAQKEKFTSMGQMMAGAAHELNNPLTAILGVSDLLRERATDDATRRQVEIVLQQARRAAGIVQNLLAFSRPTVLGRSKVHLNELIHRALQYQETSLRQKNITIQFEAPPNMPAIEGDAKLLTQVFLNIITNAEQAIASARDHGTLKISLAYFGGNLIATFSDDGPGISPENTGKIFDPFFTTKRPGGGTGLGLTICLAITKEHGGRIEVQSSPASGSTFRVILPVSAENLPQAPKPLVNSISGQDPSAPLYGHTALIVDDEDSIREIVQEGLSARGMKVEGAASAEEALSHFATNNYDVVLCDFNLPGISGDQLFEQLRAKLNFSAPPFVFMTGDLLDPAIIAAFSEKGAHVMQKPFHVAALATLLSEILQPQPAKVS
ncbi:MAG: PAS domain S-box protein [Candidatus Acidiferrales bacterium]